jgi:hypothetical protein
MTAADDIEARRQLALKRYADQEKWYDEHARQSRLLWQAFQAATVVFGGLTPILVLWSSLPKPLQALPSALAAMAAGSTGIFQWRENWTRFAWSREALRRERHLFDTRSTPHYARNLPDDVVLDRFVAAVEAVCASDVSAWQTLQEANRGVPAETGRSST